MIDYLLGGPAAPEVSYEITDYGDPKEIVLSWPRPFTWEDYDLTEYHIMCNDSMSSIRYDEVINDTSSLNVNTTFTVDISSCQQLQCIVTAYNELGSNASISNISIPQCEYICHILIHTSLNVLLSLKPSCLADTESMCCQQCILYRRTVGIALVCVV